MFATAESVLLTTISGSSSLQRISLLAMRWSPSWKPLMGLWLHPQQPFHSTFLGTATFRACCLHMAVTATCLPWGHYLPLTVCRTVAGKDSSWRRTFPSKWPVSLSLLHCCGCPANLQRLGYKWLASLLLELCLLSDVTNCLSYMYLASYARVLVSFWWLPAFYGFCFPA